MFCRKMFSFGLDQSERETHLGKVAFDSGRERAVTLKFLSARSLATIGAPIVPLAYR